MTKKFGFAATSLCITMNVFACTSLPITPRGEDAGGGRGEVVSSTSGDRLDTGTPADSGGTAVDASTIDVAIGRDGTADAAGAFDASIGVDANADLIRQTIVDAPIIVDGIITGGDLVTDLPIATDDAISNGNTDASLGGVDGAGIADIGAADAEPDQPVPCSLATCATGCCGADGQCHTQETSGQCGTGGATCSVCTGASKGTGVPIQWFMRLQRGGGLSFRNGLQYFDASVLPKLRRWLGLPRRLL